VAVTGGAAGSDWRPQKPSRPRVHGYSSVIWTGTLAAKAAAEIGAQRAGAGRTVARILRRVSLYANGIGDAAGGAGETNAGIMPAGRFADEDDAITDAILDINVKGVLTGTKLRASRHARTRYRTHRQCRLVSGQDARRRTGHVLREQARRRGVQAKRCATNSPAPGSRSPRCCRQPFAPN